MVTHGLTMNAERPILLTGYDAKRCARRIHNEWDPTIEKVAWEVPADLQVRFDAGIVFEAAVFADLKASMDEGQYVDLAAIRGKQAVVAGTLEAMDRDVALIIGGWLPDDEDGGRTGRPDLLVHMGNGRYVPGDVKAHRTVARRTKGT